MNKYWVIGGVTAVVGILTWHFLHQVNLLKKTCFGFNGYTIKELNINKIVIELRLKLRNKSDIAFTLRSYNFDIFINNTKVTTAASNVPQVIDRDSFAPLTLMIDIVPKNILNPAFLSGFLLNYQNANIKIQGTMSINAGGVSKSALPVLIQSKLRDMLPSSNAKTEPCV